MYRLTKSELVPGAPRTIFGGAVICLGAATYFGTQRPKPAELIRPIDIERGIITVK